MKRVIIGLVATAACGAAAPALAQGWGGDYGWRHQRQAFSDYPEFRGEIAHIRAEIRDGQNDGWLEDDQARGLYWRLFQVRSREAQEFRAHGWGLPDDDRYEIRTQLDQLDRDIDAARDAEGGD